MNPVARFAEALLAYPHHTAIQARGSSYSYHQLAQLVTAIQQRLSLHALPDRVGVLTGDEAHTYAALLAIMGLGKTYVPLNRHHPAERNAQIIADAGLSLILAAEPDQIAGSLPAATPLLSLDNLPLAEGQPEVQAVRPDDLAYILFTSGSTGRPKGVPITYQALHHFLHTVTDPALWQLGPEDRFLQMFDLTFDLSVYSYLVPLCMGASTYIVPHTGISYMHIYSLLEEEALTIALMVPSVLAYLRPFFDEIRLPALRYSLFCGEALPHTLAADWYRCLPHARLENVYGPTEATIFCLRYPWQPAAAEAESHQGVVPIGQPMPGVHTCVVDEDGQPVAAGSVGELCLAGVQLTPGYWQQPQLSSRDFFAHAGTRYYRTGDRVRLNEHGNYLYLGRTDQQVKIDGYRVELGEIEHHARQYTGLAQLAVVPVSQGSSTSLHLYLEGYTGPLEPLRAHLASQLPPYMQPRAIHTLARLPLNANGKIDRKALASQALQAQ